MGSLKPGATYVYERVDNKVYAREAGAKPETRKLIGWDYLDRVHQRAFEATIHSEDEEMRKWRHICEEENLWKDIRTEASHNPALQKVLDRAIMIYRLSKDKPL